jgi:hypothetical protein
MPRAARTAPAKTIYHGLHPRIGKDKSLQDYFVSDTCRANDRLISESRDNAIGPDSTTT